MDHWGPLRHFWGLGRYEGKTVFTIIKGNCPFYHTDVAKVGKFAEALAWGKAVAPDKTGGHCILLSQFKKKKKFLLMNVFDEAVEII